jgi:hypothetical protein
MLRISLRPVWILLAAVSLHAQLSSTPSGASDRKLAFVIPGFIQDALQAAGPTLGPAILQQIGPTVNLSSLNSAVATALSNLPVASSASALRYTFDPQLGVYVPSPQSLGPILTERAETIGKDKFFVSLTYQRFQFDHLDQLDFGSVNFQIPVQLPGAIPGVIDTNSALSLTISQTTAQFTYGVENWLDVSFALPVVTSSLQFSTQATVSVLPNTPIFFLPQSSVKQSSTGLGDGLARIKAKLLEHRGFTLGIAGDVRVPTGDEFNYHGAGAYGVKPFLIGSLTRKNVSAHINAGYQWNGKSFLGSSTGMEKERLPGQLFYATGVEASISPRFTAAFDLLDQIIINGRRTFLETETVGGTTFNTVTFPNLTRQELNASAGFKARLVGDVTLTGNLLFRLNDAGLRSRVVPLIGISYLF